MKDLAEQILGDYAALKSHRQSFWDPAWKAVSQLLFSREPTILWASGSKKWKPNNKMFDRTGAEALTIATSGLTSQWISPARPWMKLTVEDPVIADRATVRQWLEGTTEDMLSIFARSNTYAAMNRFVRDLLWATPVCFVDDDKDTLIRLYPEEIGSFVIDKDERGKPNVVVREFAMKAKNIANKFPNAELPHDVMADLNGESHGNGEFNVIHYVGQNNFHDANEIGVKSKKFLSVYICNKKMLRIGGYDMFPYLVGQWSPEGEEVYSVTPALDAYGDMRSLQQYAKNKLKAAEKLADPTLAVPATVGDITREPGREVVVAGSERVYNLEDIRYDWPGIQLVSGELKESVQRAFFVPLFQHFLNSTRREQTAEEVRAKLDEQYAALGPVISNMNENIAAHLIDLTFAKMAKKKLLRPIPPELAGVKLKVKYLSEFERAQQNSALRQLQAFNIDIVNMLPIIQQPPDQIDVDQIIQSMAQFRQIPETIVRDDRDISKIRKQKAQLIQQQMQQQAQAQEAENLQKLGKARVAPDTVLGNI